MAIATREVKTTALLIWRNQRWNFMMIGITRFHTYRHGVFRLLEVEQSDALKTRQQLLSEGYVFWENEATEGEKVVEHVQML